MHSSSFPHIGFGLGLRAKHYPYIFEHSPAVDWFEIISENFMDTDGRAKRNLARLKERYPIVMHGVALSIGTVDPLNSEYLQKLKALADWVKPAWISDHLCWTGVAHRNTHDLLPVPYTQEALTHIIGRIHAVQDYLGRPIALENPSTYLEFAASEIPEAEFIQQMAKATGCGLLLDVNNVYVSCYNHGLDPKAYIDALPLDQVAQIHLSGHTNKGTHIIDTHDDHVIDAVWDLYRYVIHSSGRVPNTMIEWDDRIPAFPVLQAELDKARAASQKPMLIGSGALTTAKARSTPGQTVTLKDLQNLLHETIVAGDADRVSPARDWVIDKQDFAAADQLGVYINAYRFRLRDVVGEDYPVLAHYLGRTAFDQLIVDFVESQTPQDFNIARYAAGLPGFVASRETVDGFADELCRLETAIAQLMDATETAPLTSADLAETTPDDLLDMQLMPREALQLFSFDHSVNAYYTAVLAEKEPAAVQALTTYLAVFRHNDVMWRMDLDATEYAVLQKLFAGATVGESLTDIEISDPDMLTPWFSRWIKHGLLAKPQDSHQRTQSETRHAAA